MAVARHGRALGSASARAHGTAPRLAGFALLRVRPGCQLSIPLFGLPCHLPLETRRCIFVTNDLTEKVVDEAVAKKADIIVTYHPTPFRKFNTLHHGSHISRVVLACAAHGIGVYSPHTSLDCAPGGLNDWLASAVGAGAVVPITPDERVPGAGEGRVTTLGEPATLSEVVRRVKAHLKLDHVRVAVRMDAAWGDKCSGAAAAGAAADSVTVRTAAVCAGSGGSVLSTGAGRSADVWLTGEMSHHELLTAVQAGTSVILTDHTNTERGYLPELARRIEEGMGGDAVCVVTELDADPLVVM